MLYAFPASWTLNGVGTHANEVLSSMDEEFITSADAYPGLGQPLPEAVEIAIGAATVAARIGDPGEEDLFRFRVARDGHHTVATGGETDVVMKLFGPDNPNELIAEDNDGGIGLNSRIAANLAKGDYLDQVRHFNTSRGTGDYSIGVTE